MQSGQNRMPVYQRLDNSPRHQDYYKRSKILVQLWWIVQDTLFAWSPQIFYGWRVFLLRLFGAQIGKDVRIRPSARITLPWKVNIGNHCRIGDNAVLYSLDEIEIGDHTVISQRAYLSTGSHDLNKITFDLITKPIKISDQVWIATDVFVSPGISIGRGCVVGVRSAVLDDLPEGMICFGSPAKPIKARKIIEE
jgi:putative colanic acid biosynthesis acetyltransferase WcaF